LAKNILTARRVMALVTAGKRRRHGDGGNLYLQVNAPSAGAWVFMIKRNGRQFPIGLGSVRALDLKAARAQADACRQAVHQGKDPRTALPGAVAGLTFDAAARGLIDSMAPTWRSAKHHAEWRMSLLGEMSPDGDGAVAKAEFDYCAAIRNKLVSALTTEDALCALQPIWQSKAETASRLRGRCERVWAFAKAKGLCSGENPFRWRGHLDALLPKRAKLSRGHHAAMAFDGVPAFMARLRAMGGLAPMALEFTILTAARTGEVLGATWDEIDLDGKVWTIPAERMKAGKEHRVPLSDRAVAILDLMKQAQTSPYIFPGIKRGQPLNPTAMEGVLRRAGVDVTVHGFRSSFRDWCGDRTNHPRDVVEAALAHVIENKVEAAYRRSDALAKRRQLMTAWAEFCGRAPGERGVVVPLRRTEG
jgi:integrase